MTDHFAIKSLSSISVLRFCPRVALKLLRMTKDGGYSLVDPNVLTNVHLQLLMNGQYFETDFMNWDKRCAKASLSCSILCKRVEDLEQEPELARELKKSLSTPGASIEVQLVTSRKSHKPPQVLHVMLLPVSEGGLQVNTESS